MDNDEVKDTTVDAPVEEAAPAESENSEQATEDSAEAGPTDAAE